MFLDLQGVMVRLPYVANPEMSVMDAKIYMKECDIRHLPVVLEDKIVGIVSERDLSSCDPKSPLIDCMTHNPFIVHYHESLATAVRTMAEKKYGSVLVANDAEQLVGIFTTTDALHLLENFLTGDPEVFDKNKTEIRLAEVVSWN